MNLIFKICLVNALLSFLPATFFGKESFKNNLFVYSIAIGLTDFFAGLIVLTLKKREWPQGFFTSAGIRLLPGFFICTNVGA